MSSRWGDGAPVAVVDADAAAGQVLDVVVDGGFVEGDEDFAGVAAGDVAVFADADVVPGGQAGDVGGEDVFAVDGDAHFEEGAQQGEVGGLAACAVDGGGDEGEVVDDERPFLLGNGRFWYSSRSTHNHAPCGVSE